MTGNIKDRLAELLAAALLFGAGIYLLVVVFPDQIPAGLEDDMSSGHYPKAIIFGWIGACALWFLATLLRPRPDEEIEGGRPGLRSLAIIALVGMGYVVFVQIGFIAAAALVITGLAYACGERGLWPWALGLIMPFVIFQFLDKVLDVTLPSALF